jgi:hypothetical protein
VPSALLLIGAIQTPVRGSTLLTPIVTCFSQVNVFSSSFYFKSLSALYRLSIVTTVQHFWRLYFHKRKEKDEAKEEWQK